MTGDLYNQAISQLVAYYSQAETDYSIMDYLWAEHEDDLRALCGNNLHIYRTIYSDCLKEINDAPL